MRRGNNFFRKNQYKIAAICVLAAVLGVTGGYAFEQNAAKEEEREQLAMEESEVKQKDKPVKEIGETEESAKASSVIAPKSKEENTAVTEEAETGEAQPKAEEVTAEETAASVKPQKTSAMELHFDIEAGLLWPVSGSVILDYSMDQTVYFTTLDQYKYNPAVIISGNVNDKVKAAASGKIIEISTNEVTGCTVTMDVGDGYHAIYGQLKEVPYEVGAYVEAGNTLGFVNEPTKYYALEGSNLYFAMEKDGVPVDPVEFFQ